MKKIFLAILIFMLAIPMAFAHPMRYHHHPRPPVHHPAPGFMVADMFTDLFVAGAVLSSLSEPDVVYVHDDPHSYRSSIAYDPSYLLDEISVSSSSSSSSETSGLVEGSVPDGTFTSGSPIDLSRFEYAYIDSSGYSERATVDTGLTFNISWSTFSGKRGSRENLNSTFALSEPGVITITPCYRGVEWSEMARRYVVN